MLFVIINEAGKFLADNPMLIAMILAIVEYVKRWTANVAWVKPEYLTVFGFVLGFLFAIPEVGFVAIVPIVYVSQSIALGLVATGIFKVGSTLASK